MGSIPTRGINKMLRVVRIFLILIIVVLIGTIYYFITPKNNILVSQKTNDQVATPAEVEIDPIVDKVSKMSLDQKIGQLLIIGFEHPYLDDHIKKMISQYQIGGINLLKRNVQNADQIRKLTKDLQTLSSLPLFIATDQEGGVVNRFSFLSELTPQTKIKDVPGAENVAFRRGLELKALGINMNFSPVVDYVSSKATYLYGRTFGNTAEITGELGSAMVRGYKRAGIIPVAKHFPGYGNVTLDPHKNQVTLATLSSDNFIQNISPFKKVVEDDPMNPIMTAHIVIPAIANEPATLSPEFLTTILRKEFGFKGVIITDDLEMISAGRVIEESAVEAIRAGADIIISTYTPSLQIKIFNRLKMAVSSGEISEKRLNESVVRILKLKETL